MPTVSTFSLSDNEIHQELIRVFSSGQGTAREQWSKQAQLLVAPLGWDALWKLSKDLCKRFSIRYTCIAHVTVTAVNFKDLSACVDVLSIQHEHELGTLPGTVLGVPLIELWPTIEQWKRGVNAATAAQFINLLRFYYNEIWMPWDDKGDKVIPLKTVEERMTLWSEMHNGTIPSCVVPSIALLRNSAIHAHQTLKDLYSTMAELEFVADYLLCPNYVLLSTEILVKLEDLKSKWKLYENPLTREQHMIEARDKYLKNKEEKNVVALWHGGSVNKFDQRSKFLLGRVSNKQTFKLLKSSEEALSLDAEEVVFCLKICELPEVPLMDITLCSHMATRIKSTDLRSSLLQLSSKCRLENLVLDCALVNTLLTMRSGTLHVVNCKLLGDLLCPLDDYTQGIVAMEGASILLVDCIIDKFYSGIVVHKGAKVELRHCIIKRCGVGIQMCAGSTVALYGTVIQNCREKAIRCEVDNVLAGSVTGVAGLQIMPRCRIGSGNLRKEVLVVRQDSV